jgi:hypothetical protein
MPSTHCPICDAPIPGFARRHDDLCDACRAAVDRALAPAVTHHHGRSARRPAAVEFWGGASV